MIYTKLQADFVNLMLINLIILLVNEMENVFKIDNLNNCIMYYNKYHVLYISVLERNLDIHDHRLQPAIDGNWAWS